MVPCLLIGAGFVIATTVRTAIIFASVPRGLPATAAALNEASISVGDRVGIVLVTGDRRRNSALAALHGVGRRRVRAPRRIDAPRGVPRTCCTAVGTPAFPSLAGAVQPRTPRYLDAYVTGVRTALALGGVAALPGGLVAWLGLGIATRWRPAASDPMASVYEHRDERVTAES